MFVLFLINFSKCYWNSDKHEVVLCKMQPVGFIHGMRSHGYRVRAQKHPCHVMGSKRNTAIRAI